MRDKLRHDMNTHAVSVQSEKISEIMAKIEVMTIDVAKMEINCLCPVMFKWCLYISTHQPLKDMYLFQKQLTKALAEPVESILEAGGKDTWFSIRKLLKRETEAAISEFLSAINGFELDQESVDRMEQNLRDYARKVVENKAREEAGMILILIKDR